MSFAQPRVAGWLALLPLAAALLALAATTLWPLDRGSAEAAAPYLFPVLLLAAALAGIHAPLGARSLGLGAVALPAMDSPICGMITSVAMCFSVRQLF